MIHLRAADRYDALPLAELRAASLVELGLLCAPDVTEFVPVAACSLYRLFCEDRLFAWVACDADRCVASSCVILYDRLPYPNGSRHGEVCGVYVAPAYRNRGFASELVREVVHGARGAGARKLFLRPSKLAKSLYARLGFVDTDLMTYEYAACEPPSEPILAALPSR